MKRRNDRTVTAVDASDTMVAIYPPKTWTDALREHAHPSQRDVLHTTLVYLGKKSLDEAEAALAIVQGICSKRSPLELYANGVGAFFNDGTVVRILMPNGLGLCELRAEIFEALHGADLLDEQYHGFIPHMTLEYHKDGKLDAGWEQAGNLDLPIWNVTEVKVVRGDQVVGTCKLGANGGASDKEMAARVAKISAIRRISC